MLSYPMTFPFDIDFFLIDDDEVISETLGNMPKEQYAELCNCSDIETFHEFDGLAELAPEPSRKIFSYKYDNKAKLIDEETRLKRKVKLKRECQSVASPYSKSSSRMFNEV